MKKFVLFAGLLLLLSTSSLPAKVSAFGQMTQPINITNAIRGQLINQELIIVNSDKEKIGITLNADGQIKDWVKFYLPKDMKNAISTSSIPALTNLNVIAVFAVPQDVANGEYKGVISATNVPLQQLIQNKTSATVSQKIDRQVTIKISDQETVKLNVSVIPETYDVATDQALKVRIIYDGQSNIALRPQISFKIKSGEQTVYNVIYPYPDGEPAVNAMGQHEIPTLNIPTTNLAKGKYSAQLQFMNGDKVLAEKQFGFSVGITQAVLGAKLSSFLAGNWLWLSVLILIAAAMFFGKQFKNKGEDKHTVEVK